MENDNTKKKINEIYSDFTVKIGNLLNRRKELLKTYRTKLEEAKIKEIKESMFKK